MFTIVQIVTFWLPWCGLVGRACGGGGSVLGLDFLGFASLQAVIVKILAVLVPWEA